MATKGSDVDCSPRALAPSMLPFELLFQIRPVNVVTNLLIDSGWVDFPIDSDTNFLFFEVRNLWGWFRACTNQWYSTAVDPHQH
jgi:hypothetical protein